MDKNYDVMKFISKHILGRPGVVKFADTINHVNFEQGVP